MTYEALFQTVRRIYTEKKGERFFSLFLLWDCLCEKADLPSSLRFQRGEAPDTLTDTFCADSRRLCEGYPLQYYLGYWDFRGDRYLCRENVLIPREDTALLCELCEKHLPPRGKLLDFCCGSGIVGISVLLRCPDCTGVSADLSPHALTLTGDNIRKHSLSSRLEVCSCDLFSSQAEELLRQNAFAVFACNPPYIPAAVIPTLEENVKNEPRMALDGGADGLDFYRRILRLSLLFPQTRFLCEMGYDQRAPLERLLASSSRSAEFYRDLWGNDRCFVLT